MMSKRDTLLESIAKTILDYRDGEISTPSAAHVDKWISQFDNDVQMPMLTELDYVLKRTYIPKADVKKFLSGLIKNQELAGDIPCEFWQNAQFLDIQQGGDSQRDMLGMFDQILQKECGMGVEDCVANNGAYIYLDDAIFTGNRVLSDIREWIIKEAPVKAHVHIIVMAYHLNGKGYADIKLKETVSGLGKNIGITWWRCFEIENRKSDVDSSDVLCPTSLPNDKLIQAYVQSLKYPPVLRKPGNVGGNKFFSSEDGRNLLEQEFLKAGARIRSMCPHLNKYQRPLGNVVLQTLGFGALIVTFRNCPNNAPLAFWAGNPWYPLFPRKTNL